MKNNRRKKAFTLIELLVVVLIIGILAAIALPQYQKAVERTKAMQALVLLKSLADANEAYFLTNGVYATSFDELALDLPAGFEPGGQFFTPGAVGIQVFDVHTYKDWVIEFTGNRATKRLCMGHPSGHRYQGAAICSWPKHMEYIAGETNYNGLLLCEELEGRGPVFLQAAGTFCEGIMKGKFGNRLAGFARRYYLQ